MSMDVFIGTLLCLLFSYMPCHEIATSEDGDEFEDTEGPVLPPLKLGFSTCAMKADGGPCKAILTRYYFNIQTRQCEIFDYGGCEGNENNFLTIEGCQEKCIVAGVPEKRKRGRFKTEKPSYCLLESDPGICRGLISRYFFNRETQQCEKFEYGGCLGNQNNFQSLNECQETCQDTPPSVHLLQTDYYDGTLLSFTNDSAPAAKQELIPVPSLCMMRMDRGLCRANEKRFFYNNTIGKCRPFRYTGCGGNENNFINRKSCLQMCKKDFIKKGRQQGIMKIRRKKKKQPMRQRDVEIVTERI